MTQYITRIFLKGAATVVPLVVTGYFIWWIITSFESLSRSFVLLFIPKEYYFSGLGLITIFLFTFGVGVLMKTSLLRRIFEYFEQKLLLIPGIKTIYGAFKDFFDFFSGDKKEDFSKVVLVSLPERSEKLIGFVTSQNPGKQIASIDSNTVAVYLPMSYQLGGYTVFVQRNQIEEIDMPVQEAMRYVLTAGIAKTS